MVSIPTISLFCWCGDLKVANVVIASIRIIVGILLVLCSVYMLFFYVDVAETDERNYRNESTGTKKLRAFVATSRLVLLTVDNIVTILFSYWFIMGINSKNPTKMKNYVIGLPGLQLAMLCMYAGILEFLLFVAIGLEIYFFICAYSLYNMYMAAFETLPSNTQDQPPPLGNGDYETEGLNGYRTNYP